MAIAYVRKNTEGGAAGLIWESGEVKALDSLFADELVRLAPGDYEKVSEDEFVPETVNDVEDPIEEPMAETEETEELQPAPRRQYKKKSETSSAE